MCRCDTTFKARVTCDACGEQCCPNCYDFDTARPKGLQKLCLRCLAIVRPKLREYREEVKDSIRHLDG